MSSDVEHSTMRTCGVEHSFHQSDGLRKWQIQWSVYGTAKVQQNNIDCFLIICLTWKTRVFQNTSEVSSYCNAQGWGSSVLNMFPIFFREYSSISTQSRTNHSFRFLACMHNASATHIRQFQPRSIEYDLISASIQPWKSPPRSHSAVASHLHHRSLSVTLERPRTT